MKYTGKFTRSSIDVPWYSAPQEFVEYINSCVEQKKILQMTRKFSEDNLVLILEVEYADRETFLQLRSTEIFQQAGKARIEHNRLNNIKTEISWS
jgi:hypothetical protein